MNQRLSACLILVLVAGVLTVGCQQSESVSPEPSEENASEAAPSPPTVNTLSDEERAAGWELLFDGTSTEGWRGYNKESFPESGWDVQDGNLVVLASDGSEEGQGGDIITTESFDNFELSLEFNVSTEANSGILYRVNEQPDAPIWWNAPEYQVLDDDTYVAMDTMDMDTHLTGDNYDLQSAAARIPIVVGDWYRARILVDGNHVEHWLNDQKMVEYELGSPEWEEMVKKSKFAEYEGYGRSTSGPIGLQDHGHMVRYRNIKIRRIE